MTEFNAAAAFIIAFGVSYFITPLTARFALKINFVDRPGAKKVHTQPTALLGGAAIFVSFMTALSFAARIDRDFAGTFVGGALIMLLGLIDDKVRLMPKVKLLGQITAAFIVVMLGLRVSFIKDPFLSSAFTCLWLVGITNAFNLIDNINGLSAGIAAIASLFFGTLVFIHGDIIVAVVSFALTGSCLGFLRYNFPRAGIFMGDAGSMFLGFMLASVAVAGSWKTSSVTTSLAIPVLILSYPIFDVTLVTITRLAEGRPVSAGGKDHSSHRFAIAIMESIMRSRNKSDAKGAKILPVIAAFAKGLRKKGFDRSPNRLAALGFKKKRAILILYAVSFAMGCAALAMSALGKYYDWAIMIISLVLMLFFGIRLGMVRVNAARDKADDEIQNRKKYKPA